MSRDLPQLPEKVLLPESIGEEPFTVWVYDNPGEPAFALTFKFDVELYLDVTPMHMDGSEAEVVRVTAR